MTTTGNSLAKHLAAADSGAGFVAVRDGGLAIVTPLTERARAWLQLNVPQDATWLGNSVAVEMRYFPDLADVIISAGFLFEREAYPN